jgi:probable O-glycosylation ligase (exosortase A-associated)
MRSLAFLLFYVALCGGTVIAPYIGALAWIWIALMSPHQYVYGIASSLPVNLIEALITLGAWVVSKEPKRIPLNACTLLLLLFMLWISLTTLTSLAPDSAWELWQRNIKNLLLGLVIAGLMTNRIRLHALAWTVVFSLGYFGIKGGLFTIITAGGGHVMGEAGVLGDNNNFALAMCMVLPLMNYLRLSSEHRLVRLGLLGGMVLTVIAILGTYSRGGLIGLSVAALFLLSKSQRKLLLGICGIAVLALGYTIMPDTWTQRMDTIQSAGKDDSFQGRVQVWRFSYNIALAHPLVGGGLGASENGAVFNTYSTDYVPFGRAAHSIYFQVLGDHGFAGLLIFLALLGAVWRQCTVVKKRATGRPELAWAMDLATMIQVSWAGYMVAGAALSMAYYDLAYIELGAIVALRQIVRQVEIVPARPAPNLAAGANLAHGKGVAVS